MKWQYITSVFAGLVLSVASLIIEFERNCRPFGCESWRGFPLAFREFEYDIMKWHPVFFVLNSLVWMIIVYGALILVSKLQK